MIINKNFFISNTPHQRTRPPQSPEPAETGCGSAAALLRFSAGRQDLRGKNTICFSSSSLLVRLQSDCQLTHLTPLPVPAQHGQVRDAREQPIREQFFIRKVGQELSWTEWNKHLNIMSRSWTRYQPLKGVSLSPGTNPTQVDTGHVTAHQY